MTDNAQLDTVLVLGGTGKTGRRILERLAARGVPARAGSRSGEPPFDWEDRDTWEPALRGATALYISYFPDLAVPGAAEAVAALAELAVAGRVRRIVLLSGRGEEEAQRAERLVQAAAPDCTIVRSAWFSQNFSESHFLDGVLAGTVALPVTGVREPFVDADDIADVAVAALTEDGHAGQLYELTGPRALSFAEAVAEIAAATGRDVRLASISMDEFESALAAEQVPPDLVALLRFLFAEVLDGRNEQLADGVQRALGRAPRDFRTYARDAAATGVWDPGRAARQPRS